MTRSEFAVLKWKNRKWLRMMNKLHKEGGRHLGYGNCLFMLRGSAN